MIVFTCPTCQQVHRASESRQGQKGTCRCGQPLVVPSSGDSPRAIKLNLRYSMIGAAVLLVLTVFILFLNTSTDAPPGSASQASVPPVGEAESVPLISSVTLWTEFNRDRAAAEKKYVGRRFDIEGLVARRNLEMVVLQVDNAGRVGSKSDTRGVNCILGLAQDLPQLKEGRKTRLRGIVEAFENNGPKKEIVVVRQCALVASKP